MVTPRWLSPLVLRQTSWSYRRDPPKRRREGRPFPHNFSEVILDSYRIAILSWAERQAFWPCSMLCFAMSIDQFGIAAHLGRSVQIHLTARMSSRARQPYTRILYFCSLPPIEKLCKLYHNNGAGGARRGDDPPEIEKVSPSRSLGEADGSGYDHSCARDRGAGVNSNWLCSRAKLH
jgi:hypothetical protein